MRDEFVKACRNMTPGEKEVQFTIPKTKLTFKIKKFSKDDRLEKNELARQTVGEEVFLLVR
jgi:hypothetical protein